MKTLVCTLRYGAKTDWMDACVPTLEAWCARHDYLLQVWDDPSRWADYPCPKFVERDMLKDFIEGDFDRLIYVDADVYVNPEAPEFPNLPGMAMATDAAHREHNKHWRDWCEANYDFRPEDNQGLRFDNDWDYANAGIWSVDREGAERLLHAMGQYEMIEEFQEQHWFNLAAYLVHTTSIAFKRLPSEWNRWGAEMNPAWMTHFWGSNKMRDMEDRRRIGLLDKKPDGLRYAFMPDHHPKQDKVMVLQFVKDCGLGNQMFECAAGLAIARSLGIQMILNWKPTPKRKFGLGHFGIGVLPFFETPVVSAKLGQGNIEIFEKAAASVHDSEHRFPAISHPFQCEECFDSVTDEVRELFKLEPFPLDCPEGKTPVGIQVRRGDYVGHSRLDVVTQDYFLNAIDFFRRRTEHPQFYFVSDDPTWCRQQFSRLPDVTVMPPQSAIDGLRTLASCEAHVISNSTFGWWGAWLGEKGPVVVPEIWHHKPGSYGKWNPVPERWHKVPIGRPVQKPLVKPKPMSPVGFKAFPRQFERAIVVPWHAGLDKWQSLRFCLRSIHRNFTDRGCPIVILGTKRPGWLTYAGHRVRYIETHSYEEALMHGVQIADEVCWMNDDILFLKPTGWDDLRRPRHFGEVTPEFLAEFIEKPNPWRDNFREAVARLADAGTKVIRNYSVHIPYLYKLEQATETLKRFPITGKYPYELLYYNLHAGEIGLPMDGERVGEVPFGNARYLNHTDHRLDDLLKEAIRERFPDFAPWELKAKFDS